MQEKNKGFSRGRKRRGGMDGGVGMGPGGECLCPNCGHKETHRLGEPCYSRKCPKCGVPMARA